jgi:GNAT superfamily N-acetyltransferase
MKVKPAIVFPQNAEQIAGAYHRYLESIAAWSHLLPTEENARAFADLILIPAWERKEPILFATLDKKIIGATFTTLPDERFAYRVPFASGHGTWVAPSWRNRGVAKLLMT